MLEGLVGGLFVAWILSCFEVDLMFIEVLQPFTSIKLSTAHFYATLSLIGLLGRVIGK